MNAKKLSELAMLSGTALIIFVIELRLPDLSAIQGVKLGLANIITVYAVYKYSAKEVLLIVLTRVLLGSVFSGNPAALIYSLAGALTCLGGMLAVKKVIPVNYIWLCSMIGAVLHNIGQITAAFAVTRTAAVFASLPILIISGCIAGLFTGICAKIVVRRNIRRRESDD